MQTYTQYRVVATHRDGRQFFSWHSTKEQAKQAAKDQRSRQIWRSVRVDIVTEQTKG